ncbi:MAG: cysteine desulfurase family protein [Planctomycetota bacterium]
MSSARQETFYFDHNASTAVDERVLDRFLSVEREFPANPSSLHRAGRQANEVVREASDEIAELFGLSGESVLFVSGGTEANNMAVQNAGIRELPVLLGPVEHPSVYDAAAGRGRVIWSVDESGMVLVEAPEERVGLLCLVQGQNEVGSLQPIESASSLAEELSLPLHVDAAQVLGRMPLDRTVAVADSITLSAHKVGGLRGMGVLLQCRRNDIAPLLHGGQQQGGRRPGTLSPSLAAATATALRLAVEETEARAIAMRAARDAFHAALPGELLSLITPEHSLPNTLMLRFDVPDGRNLLPALDLAGVQASQGSACSAGAPTPPRILAAMGLSEQDAERCVRFSFSWTTEVEAARRGAETVREVLLRMRRRVPMQ